MTLGISFKWLRKCKKRKAPQQSAFIPGVLCEYTGNAFSGILVHTLQREKDDECISQIVLVTPSFQRNSNLQSFLPNISDLELQMKRFLPRTFQICYTSKGIARSLGNTRAVLWLPFICIFSLTMCVSVFQYSMCVLFCLLLSTISCQSTYRDNKK